MYGRDLAAIHHEGFSEFAESAAQGLIELLQRKKICDGRIVDAGCGSGVVARALLLAGYRVAGFDASESMVAIARRTAPDAELSVAGFEDAVLPSCRAIVSIGEVLNHGSTDSVLEFFARAADAIEPGGMLLFDVAEEEGYPERQEVRVGGEAWSVISIRERDGNCVTHRVLTFRAIDDAVVRSDETHTLQLHPREVLTASLRSLGFRVTLRRSWGKRRLPKGHAAYVCVRASASPQRPLPSDRLGKRQGGR